MLQFRSRTARATVAVALALSTISATAQSVPPPLNVPPAQTFPNEDLPRSSFHLNRARQIAGEDMYPAFQRRCILSQIYSQYANSAEAPLQMQPVQIFDNMYFIGQGAVSAWAVETSEGLVIIDALNNPSEAEYILVEGLRKLGLDPADMKYLIVTHEHGDHFNGARYLQDTYGVQVVASDVAWTSMDNGTASRPRRNITVSDGQRWTVGDTTFEFYVTPGHTNGALSILIPVVDHGQRHLGAMYGGWGIPGSVAGKVQQLTSVDRFAAITRAAGVDVLLANHQTQDMSLYNHDLLRHRRLKPGHAPNSPADFLDPNPYVVGVLPYQRFLRVQTECILTSAARSAQVIPGMINGGVLPPLDLRIVPDTLDLRNTAATVTATFTAPEGYNLSEFAITDLRLEGAAAMTTALSSDGRTLTATFRRSDLAVVPAGIAVRLMATGTFRRSGQTAPLLASTLVRVMK